SLEGLLGFNLNTRTVGVIGTGRIGSVFCRIMQGFGCRVLAYDPTVNTELQSLGVEYTNLVTLFSESDIISLHCPLTPDTTGLINADNIARMKRGVYLINTARGAMIAEQALADALQTGHIAGAALDTLTTEPPPANHPLMKWDNVIITPHVGGSSDLSLTNMGMGAAKNILAVLRGEPIDTTAVKNKAVVN
ncbi:MAG TPA: hypothetical protein DIT58_08520, partial [Porticoccaceae bacterium]|nr:hypothetical protein [Porticoccaceae bacterium]